MGYLLEQSLVYWILLTQHIKLGKKICITALWKTKACFRSCGNTIRWNVALSTFKKNKLWIWKAYCTDTVQRIECGNGDTIALKKWLQRLKKWNVTIYMTDNWKSYAEVIPEELLVQSKKYTSPIERNNSRQRHWFLQKKNICCIPFFRNGRFHHVSFCQVPL